MEILKLATEWARDEIFSTRFFILFALMFLVASLGFWQLGKTDLAKAFIIPTLVAGVLIMIVGVGLYFTNKSRLNNFEKDYQAAAAAFVQAELTRADNTIGQFENVFKIIPAIIAVAALLMIFVDKPLWRAICMTTIAMMIIILLVDANSTARMEDYKQELELAEKQLRE
ncbi:MAG: hypothetical protein AAFR61_22280 [Bacteroidota bacterium]